MTRVCLFSSAHRTSDTRIFYREATSLVRAGYEVLVVGTDDPGVSNNNHGIKILSTTPPPNRFHRFFISPWRSLKLALGLHARLYHLHDPELLPVALILKLLNRRVIYDIHEDYPRQLLDKNYLPRWLRRFLSRMFAAWEGFVCRYIDGVIAATEPIGRRFHQGEKHTARPRVITVMNYPDELPKTKTESNPPVTKNKDQPFRLIHLANVLSPERGISLLVQALAALPDCELILAGRFVNPAYEAELRSRPEFSQVHYLGIISHQQCFDWYARSDVGVVPSLPVLGYELALPVKMFEFMLAGLPVVVPDFPPLKAIITATGCGVTFPPGSLAGLITALRLLKADPQLAQAMGNRGRTAARVHYNWKNEEKKLLSFYERII